ncbi:MAG: 50S ribosomal protein L21 [Clostridia bacterium]|nr:50S ribosomal protein L21 [Clostridia bacterium]
MFAVFETGGKQYKVSEGDIIFVEKLGAGEGETVTFDRVLAVSRGETTEFGAPYLDGAKIEATVVKNGKAKKIVVFKYKPKKNEKKKQGHRQPYTKIQIASIVR